MLTFFQPKTTRAYILLTAQMASSVTAKKGGRPTTFSVAAKAAASDPRQSTLSWAMVLKNS